MKKTGSTDFLEELTDHRRVANQPGKHVRFGEHANTSPGLSWGGGRSEVKEEPAAGRRGT